MQISGSSRSKQDLIIVIDCLISSGNSLAILESLDQEDHEFLYPANVSKQAINHRKLDEGMSPKNLYNL